MIDEAVKPIFLQSLGGPCPTLGLKGEKPVQVGEG